MIGEYGALTRARPRHVLGNPTTLQFYDGAFERRESKESLYLGRVIVGRTRDLLQQHIVPTSFRHWFE